MARWRRGRSRGRRAGGRRRHARVREGPWPRISARERGRILTAGLAPVRERQEELATLEARNGGKPIGSARAEIDIVANVFEYWGGAANKIMGETIPIVPPGIDLTLREPVGVCALITPWNFPAVIASWKIAPALACGNTAVVKPASQTPLTALALADILTEAGLPEGTLSVLPGPGSTTASALVADPRVAKVSFTGSTEVGHPGDAGGRGRTSPACRSSSAASRRTSCSTTPISTLRRRARCGRSSTTRGRTAAPARACSCSGRLRRVRRAVRGPDRRDPRGAAARRGDRDGPADLAGAAPDLARLPRDRDRRGCAPRDRRRGARRARVLHAAGGARRRRQRVAGRAGGDLRSGRVHHAVRDRGGGDPPRERLAVRAVGLDLDPRPRPSDPRRRRRFARATSA